MSLRLRFLGRIAFNSFITRECRLRMVSTISVRKLSMKNDHQGVTLDASTYDKVCSETLDSLCYYFEEITEKATNLGTTDVTYGDGVLTVNLGQDGGTYVINRQTPNKQIWLSSPTSGPKRYDFVGLQIDKGKWVYKHSGESLHELLQEEIKNIIKEDIDFFKLPYSK